MRRTTPLQVLVLFALVAAVSFTALSAGAAVARPWLGVFTQVVTGDLRDGLDLPDSDAGVLVNRVVEDSPADWAGVRQGDLIVRFNSRLVESPDALARMVGDAHNGQNIALEIRRHGDRRTLSVTLAPRPGNDDDSMAPTPPSPPGAPRPPGDADDDNDGDNTHPKMHMHIVTPDGEHGSTHVYRFDGDMDKIPAEVHRMLGNMHLKEFNLDGGGDGTHRIVVRSGDRARLGVRIETLNDDLAGALNAPGNEGVLVLEVMKDTPAERAGLKAGDVIVAVNDHGVKNAEELQDALRGVDGKASLSVSRKGERRTVEAELGSPGPGRMEELEGMGRPQARQDAGGDDLRKELDDMRQQLRELRQQLEEQREHR